MSGTRRQQQTISQLTAEIGELKAQLSNATNQWNAAVTRANKVTEWIGKLISEHVRLTAFRDRSRRTFRVEVQVTEEMLLVCNHGEDYLAIALGQQIASSLRGQQPPPRGLFIDDCLGSEGDQ